MSPQQYSDCQEVQRQPDPRHVEVQQGDAPRPLHALCHRILDCGPQEMAQQLDGCILGTDIILLLNMVNCSYKTHFKEFLK